MLQDHLDDFVLDLKQIYSLKFIRLINIPRCVLIDMYRAVPKHEMEYTLPKNQIIQYPLNFYVHDMVYVFHQLFDILLLDQNQQYE